MQEVADKHNLPIEVKAFPDNKVEEIVNAENPDVILLGPQVKYKYNAICEKLGDKNILIEVIDQADYGTMNGEKVLKSAVKLIKSKK